MTKTVKAILPGYCRGLDEYYEALKVLKNPKHKEYAEYSALFGKLKSYAVK